MRHLENFQRKNHIKYVFLFRDKSTIKFSKTGIKPRYLFGYLTDDHKVFFDEFRLKDTGTFQRSALRRFIKKTRLHYIDSKTEVCYYFGAGHQFKLNDIMYMLWTIYHRGYGFHMNKLSLGDIANRLNLTYRLHLFGDDLETYGKKMHVYTAMKGINQIFSILVHNKICSWIDEDFEERLARINPTRARYYRIVSVGLYYMCIRSYQRYLYQLYQARNLRKKQKESKFGPEMMVRTSTILMDKDKDNNG